MSNYTIGKLANLSGLSIDTIRFYEKEGVLTSSSRSKSGYRQFSPKDLQQALFIKKAKKLGFTLNEIKELILLSDDTQQCLNVESKAVEKLQSISERIADLERIKIGLENLVKCCRTNKSPNVCPLLSSIGGDNED